MQKERNYGIDLLRMVSMFLVVVLHILGHGGILSAGKIFSVNYEVSYFVDSLAFCAVDCYALISGFVGYEAKFKLSNILYLYIQVFFYSVFITIVVYIIKPGTFGFLNSLHAVLPVICNQYWYFVAYFGMFFFIPVLNRIVKQFTKNQLFYLIVASIFVFSLIPTLAHKDVFVTEWGYSTLWLSVLYIIGAYIKKYNIHSQHSARESVLVYLICVILSWSARVIVELFTTRFLGGACWGMYLLEYTSPTIIFAAIALLIMFSNLKFKKPSSTKIIAFLSPLAFGVYLIHNHPLLVDNFVEGSLSFLTNYSAIGLIVSILLIAIVTYIICSAIDYLRLKLFTALKIRELCMTAESHIQTAWQKIEFKHQCDTAKN